MKKTRIFLTLMLVIAMLFSILALGSCEWIKGLGQSENPPHSHSFVEGKCECGETDPSYKPDGGKPDDGKPDDEGNTELPPESDELDAKFYDAKNWVYMTNNNGASLDGGDIPYTMADGSIKFHRANQAIEMGDMTNAVVSFMVKATNDFSIWFNSSSIDNANNSSYRFNYAYGQLRIALSSAPEQAAAVISDENYNKGEWNKVVISFSTTDNVCQIKVWINDKQAELQSGDNTTPMVNVSDNTLTHTQPAMFKTGNYMVVKVWEAHNYIQIKPVAKADEKDLPIIACIGASITEGAGAGNFYTESYPAQLQNALQGNYNVVNFGNSGKTVRTDLGDDVAWLKQYQWAGVQAIVPDIAILNIGTNDSKTSNNPVSTYESFYEAYQHLIDELLKVNPEMQIVICTVPYAYSGIWDINNDNIANIIAPVQRDIAAAGGHTLIDLYEYSQNKAHLFPDGVHPNTKGYQMFVKIIEKVILEGESALTDEFIAAINEEYAAKVPNAYADVQSVVVKDMTLTVTGKTNDAGLLLYIGQGDGKINYTKEITLGENDEFSVSFDLTTIAIGSDWYNVRLYFTDGNYRTVSLNELTDGNGGTYGLWSHIPLETTQLQVCSWDESGTPTLSFCAKEYTKPVHTISISGGSIVATGDKIILTVTGNTTDKNAVLLVGPTDDVSLYGHPLDVADDGSFTATFDLATLAASGDWQNARLIMADGNGIVVPYDILGVNVDDEFYSSNKKVVVKTWGGEKILSLSVSNYDSSYTLTATEVKFENGKLVFSGTTQNVRTLTAYLYNDTEGIMDYKADATLNADGSFTVEIDLAQLTMAAGNWYYLWTSVNGGDLTKVVYENYDASEYYGHGFRTYKWEYWEGIAVNYSNFEYSLTNTTISEVDGKATLTIEGYLKDSSVAADTITLILDKTKGTQDKITLTNLATEAGQFKFVYDVSELVNSAVTTQFSEEAYFIRLYVNGAKKADLNSRWAAADLFEHVNIGTGSYYFMRNSGSAWNTLGLVRLDYTKPLPVVTPTDIEMVGNKLVFIGKAENVDSLVVYLYDSNEGIDSYNATANISSDGIFTASIDLDQLTASAGNWYFVMISVNGEEKTKISGSGVTFGNLTSSGFRNYNWASKDNIAISYSNIDYSITEHSITDVDGKAILTIAGIMKDSTVVANTITLRLDKTQGTKEQINLDNLATEAGQFKFVYDISGIINSDTTNKFGEQAYFIRLFVNGSKKADINSRWAAADLFEEVIIGSGRYYFMRNSESAWNTLGLVRLEYVAPEEPEVTYDYFLQGGRVSVDNMPMSIYEENGIVYYTFTDAFGGSNKDERTIELILTTEDPTEYPTSVDASKIVYTASNAYTGDSNTAFEFKVNLTEIGKINGWIRFILKVTEGDTVSYYTIKPTVPSHNGDWVVCSPMIELGGAKYEHAICWSSVFIQIV